MAIYLTGDTHGDVQKRLGVKNFPEQKDMDSFDDNYVIILGDFGVIWDQEPSAQEKYILNWLDEKPFQTLFIDGNHENHDRLASMPVIDYLGGKVHKISDGVYHLMRGEMYDINGYSFFCFGGASSHDASVLLDPVNDPNWKLKRKKLMKNWESFRVIGQTWWESEVPNDEEKQHGLATLATHGNKCDFILTHTPPASIVNIASNNEFKPDDTEIYLESIKQSVDYKHWFSGHLHEEMNVTDKDHILYHQLFLLSNRTSGKQFAI